MGPTSEDCLYLNVWTPSGQPVEGLPVMVWIHGGAFTTGAASIPLYHGANLAACGVVVVTVNYRLGPLGFLAHPDLSAESGEGVSGNYGLLDQVAALKWIRENIHAFGGNAGCVTLFGQSAGASSICLLLTSPYAAGLFHRAIVQSAPLWVKKGLPAASRPLEEEEKAGIMLAQRLGLSGPGVLEPLRQLPAERLVEVANPAAGIEALGRNLQFGPAIDGNIIPGDPVVFIAGGKFHDVPLMVGSNAREADLFTRGLSITPEQYREAAGMLLGDYSEGFLDLFPVPGGGEAVDALGALFTVTEFTAPARFLAGSFENRGSAWLYDFIAEAPGNPPGPCHGAEIPYVFGNLEPWLSCTDSDRKLSRLMMDLWTGFARLGDPGGDGLPRWPEYSRRGGVLLELGREVKAARGRYHAACSLAEKMHLERSG